MKAAEPRKQVDELQDRNSSRNKDRLKSSKFSSLITYNLADELYRRPEVAGAF